jgi:hypothetical protein
MKFVMTSIWKHTLAWLLAVLVALGLALAYPGEAIVLHKASPAASPNALPAAAVTPSTA